MDSRDIGIRYTVTFGISDFVKLDVRENGCFMQFGKSEFGKLAFRKLDISVKCPVREIGIRRFDFGKRYIREISIRAIVV